MIGSALIRSTAAVVALALPAVAGAQTFGGTTTGQARASIIRPIAISQATPLDFGVLTPGADAVTVTLSPAGGLTASNPGSVITSAHSAGAFDVTGQASRVYTVSVPTGLDLTAGGQTIPLSALQYQFDGAAAPGGTGLFDGSGQQRFTVGATLTLAPGQSPGDYAGNYVVTVSYQ